MNLLTKIWISISIILLGIIILKLLDAQVSLKYEVSEPRAILGDNKDIVHREKELQSGIIWLWVVFSYVLISIFGFIKYIRTKNKV
ncbi:MAG: hypothetical protein V4547_07110 [Bacteroidota bacterium]